MNVFRYVDSLIQDCIAIFIDERYIWIRCEYGWWYSKDRTYFVYDDAVIDDILDNSRWAKGRRIYACTKLYEINNGMLEDFKVPEDIINYINIEYS